MNLLGTFSQGIALALSALGCILMAFQAIFFAAHRAAF